MKGKKFRFISIGVVTCFALLIFSPGAKTKGKFNWRKYEGTTIRVLDGKSAFTPITQKWVKAFEKKTGIKVKAEHLFVSNQRRKVSVEMAGKNEDLDVFAGMMKTNYQWYRAGWLEPLDKYIKDRSMTSPDFNYNDFFPRVRSVIDGKTIGITTSVNPQVLMYRKDLFRKYRIKVPKTWAELEAAAKKLTLDTDGDGKTDIFGWAARLDSQNTAPFANFLYGNGGRWLDKNRKPVFNSPEAVEAMEFYGRLARKYGPPGGNRLGYMTVIGAFARGKVAMTVDVSIFAKLMIEKSPVVKGKVGYAPVPVNKSKQIMIFPCNTTHISSLSKKKGAAWYYVQFMSNKRAVLDYQINGLATARKSAWKNRKFKRSDTLPALTKIQYQGFKSGIVGFEIPIAGFVEARKVISQTIFTAYEGGNVQKAADKAVKKVAAIMKRTE